MRLARRSALFVPALLIAAPVAHAAEPVTGQWLTEKRNAVVTISPCGKAVCGKITRILTPDPKGDGSDRKNPNPAHRKRPILGMTIIPGFTDAGDDWRGEIYSPEAGRSYRGYLSKQPDGSLRVKGCIAFLCQNQKWTPAE